MTKSGSSIVAVFVCSSVVCPVIVVLRYLRLWHDEDDHAGHIIWFAVPRKSTRLYLNLTLIACDKIWLVDSTVFACSSVICPAFVALL